MFFWGQITLFFNTTGWLALLTIQSDYLTRKLKSYFRDPFHNVIRHKNKRFSGWTLTGRNCPQGQQPCHVAPDCSVLTQYWTIFKKCCPH